MMVTAPPDLTTNQLAQLYLEALRLSNQDPEAALAAVYLGNALDRRRGIRGPLRLRKASADNNDTQRVLPAVRGRPRGG